MADIIGTGLHARPVERMPAGASALLRWGIPAALVTSIWLSFYLSPAFYGWFMEPHRGVLEGFHGAIVFTAFCMGLRLLFQLRHSYAGPAWWWIAAYTLGVFYFLGEDLNWGQYYFDWTVPQYFLENNKEQETNLHNMSPWFNQKPRMMVELWVLLAGILVPLGWRLPVRLTRRFVPEVLWPGRETLILAVLATAARLPDRAVDLATGTFGLPAIELPRCSELQEFCFGWFMAAYIWFLARRLRERTPTLR